MAIGVYFRTAYERIKINFKNKKYDPVDTYNQIRADMFPHADWSNINPKDVAIGCLKFVAEDLTDIEIFDVGSDHSFQINRSNYSCIISTRPVYILIQNYNSFDNCTVQCHYAPAIASNYANNYYDEIAISTLIIDTICSVLTYAYQEYYFGRSKYNL